MPELPIPVSYKEALSPPPPPRSLASTTPPETHLSSFPLLPRALVIIFLSMLLPPSHSQCRPLLKDLRNEFFAPPCSHAPRGEARRATHQRDRVLSPPLVHGEPPHAQSIELWTPIFVRKINLSKPISRCFVERPSSFMKTNPRRLIS
jgi:hypothetical protein